MRYFLDTEFVDNGQTIDLISIGLVAEDGREYYAQLVEFDEDKANTWVQEHVLPHLVMCPCCGDWPNHEDGKCRHQRCPWRTRLQLKREIETFINTDDGKPELWGWCSGYDWVVFCQLFGTMMDLPANYPHYMRDIQFLLDERSMSDDDLPADQHAGQVHNALADARYIGQLWTFLHRRQ